MTNLWPLGLLLCSCLMTTMAGHVKRKEVPRYWLLFPKVLRSDSSMDVGLYFTAIESNVSLVLDLFDHEGRTLQNGQSYSIAPNEGFKVVSFKLWSKLKRPFYAAYIRATACGGVEFDYFERLMWKNRRVSVLLQTDRTLYHPGMTVKFRALAMKADGSVSDEAMEVVVKDPHQNQVARWTREKGSGNLGVFEGEMLTATDPFLGVYSIRALVKGASKIKYITLRKYDAADFEISLAVPRVDYNDDNIIAKVKASYKVGTPVCGKGTLAVQIPRYSWWWYRRYHILEVKKKFELDRYGKAVVKFSSREMMLIICRYYYPWYWYSTRYRYRCYYATYYLKYRRVRFVAEVTDAASHEVVKKIKDIYLTAHKTRLRFTYDTPWRFKPALPLFVSVADMRTNGKPNNKPVQPFINYTVTYMNSTRCSGRYWWYWWYWWRSTWQTHLEKTVDLDAEKIATLTTTVPADACLLKIKATNGKFTVYKYMSRYYSINGTYLHVELNKPLSVDKKRTVTVMSNKKFGNFTVKGYSQSDLVLHKTVTVKELAYEHTFQFDVDISMRPVLHLLCYYMHSSGEVIADSESVFVEYNPNKVSLRIDGDTEAKKKPGEKTTIRVNAKAGTEVYILGKDERTQTKRNDLKQEDAIAGQLANDPSRYKYGYSYEADVFDIFRNTGLGMFTNYIVPGRYYYHYYYSPIPYRWSYYYYYRYGRSWYYECKRIGPFPRPPARGYQLVKKYPEELDQHILPDTALWKSVTVTGAVETVKFVAPNTITSLNFTAFAVNPHTGLTFAQVPLMLSVEKRVLVSIFMPEWAVLGETICMNVVAHNTGEDNATLTLKLKKSSDFENVKIKKEGGKRTEIFTSENLKRELGQIEAGTKKVEVFCIKPSVTGDIKVEVSVGGSGSGKDDLEKSMKVKPKGLKKCKTYPFLIEISPSKGFSATTAVTLPSDVVENSYSVSAHVTGDLLLATAHKISDLDMTPTGCGEENILHLSVLSSSIAYLSEINRLPEKLLAKAKNAMQTAYMQLLVSRRFDGAFSAFGNRDPHGSVRMTALVASNLAKAWELGSNGIKPEPDVVGRCIDFITAQQNVDGSFKERGRVLHKDIQGGSAANKISRTAFIVLALHDTKKFLRHMDLKIASLRVERALPMARSFLENNLGTDNTYSLAIGAYALKVLDSPKAAEALEKMNKTSTMNGNQMYWDGEDEIQSVEMTSYALMVMMAHGAEEDALKVYRWLNSKRTAHGEFGSMQATALGVQALSRMTELAPKGNFSLTVDVNVAYKKTATKTKGKSAKFDVTQDNDHELQKSDMKWRNTREPLEITVEGTVGSTSKELYAYAEVTACYHVKSITESGKLSTSVQVLHDKVRSFTLRTCVKRMSSDSQIDNHLVMASVYLPTAYTLDKTASTYGSSVAKARLDKGRLTMYYSRLNGRICSTLKFKMVNGNVANVQPARVIVENKYNASEVCLMDFTLQQRGLCDVAGKHPGCKEEEE